MMDVKEFKKDFMENVRTQAIATGEGSCASFVSGFAEYLEGAEVLLDFTASYFEGIGKRNRKLRVDGYAFDEFDKTMSLIIADFDSSDRENVITRTQATQLQERLVYFVDQSLNSSLHSEIEMSRACSDLVDLLREKRSSTRKYQLMIFTTSIMSTTIKSLDITEIDGVPVECQIWDIDRLFKVCGSVAGRSIIEINFKEYAAKGIPCIEASDTATKDFKSYLCIIPGVLLADIYDRHGSLLLEGNVRSFLSTKVAVNKKIRTTILQSPERFFAYNNGIAATAINIKTEITSEGLFLIGATDFQIINGGQTTASLSNARHKDKADLCSIFVQMKLTVIERSLPDEATELMQNISRSSNSQNKVSDADFFSTHPFHIRMEQFSQRLYARATGGSQFDTKWFYERARGQYLQKQMRLTTGEKKKFLLQNPKSQLVTKTDLAKVRNSWKCLPHIVSRGAQTNFSVFAESINKDWTETNEGLIFNERYWQESVALILLFRYTEIMVSHQPWYTQSYRANIVTYTMALLNKLIMLQYPGMNLDLVSIWMRQSVPSPITLALTSLSELVYNKLTDQNRKVENVTQWCKREDCWESVSSICFNLSAEINTCLIDKAEKKIAERQAKSDQHMLLGVELQTKVCTEISLNQWNAVMNFAMSKRMVTPDESTALRVACQIPVKIPTPAQSKQLLEVLERVQKEGFKL